MVYTVVNRFAGGPEAAQPRGMSGGWSGVRCGTALAGLVLVVLMSACGAEQTGDGAAAVSVAGDTAVDGGPALSGKPCAVPGLLSLWRQRLKGSADFPIGPGDVLEISVPEVDELQKQRVEVSGEGSVALPLLGTLPVAGLQEVALRQELLQRLGKYMKQPRVELFVDRRQSRAVAVVGAVQKPGLYDLVSSQETLLDVLDQAGGVTAEAAQRLSFFPAENARYSMRQASFGVPPLATVQTVSGSPISAAPSGPPGAQAGREAQTDGPTTRDYITVDLAESSSQGCLGLPARPGDALVVPVAGQVMVEGWVRNPGAFAITPGMTILGAVSAAGGAMFSWSARLLRAKPDGSRVVQEVSLTSLESGRQPDVLVRAGDVVVVEKSAVGAVPYAMEGLFDRFATGLAFPIP